jgi:hypothetical protein
LHGPAYEATGVDPRRQFALREADAPPSSGRTEQCWCPIKHARRILQAHTYYNGFVDFGDAESYRRHLKVLRAELAALDLKNS